MNKKIIVDAPCLCYRAFYAMNSDPKGVVLNFIMQLLTLGEFLGTNNFVFCWDSKTSKRKEIYPEYKKKRHSEKSKEELEIRRSMYKEFDKIRDDVVPGLGFKNNLLFDGFEADDIAATVAANTETLTDNILITTDEDWFQLLSYGKIWNPNKKSFTTRRSFYRKYGVQSWKWSWVKSYAGCTSDEVKGICGVGEKTAIGYIKGKLNPFSKKYQAIVSKAGKEIYNRNITLVRLPFPGLPEIKHKQNELSVKSFRETCRKHNLHKLASSLMRWKSFLLQDIELIK